MSSPYDKYNTPRKNLLQRFGPTLGWIALVVVILSIAYCGITQTDIRGRSEGWSAVTIIGFIIVGLLLVGIIPGWSWLKRRVK